MPIRLVKKDILRKSIDVEVRTLKIDSEQSMVKGFEENKLIVFVKKPLWIDGKHGETEALSNFYIDLLKIADENNCKNIAIPLYFDDSQFPKELVYPIASKIISEYLKDSELTVYLVVDNIRTFKSGFGLKNKLRNFISKIYIPKDKPKSEDVWGRKPIHTRYSHTLEVSDYARRLKKTHAFRKRMATANGRKVLARRRAKTRAHISDRQRLLLMDELAQKPSETFSEAVLRIITEKGWKDPDCYKAANMDKRLFSKIRCNRNYHPDKKTAISLAIALELNINETNNLLGKAGYALSESDKRDVIVMFFIRQEIFDILELDGVLLENGQEMLTKYD